MEFKKNIRSVGIYIGIVGLSTLVGLCFVAPNILKSEEIKIEYKKSIEQKYANGNKNGIISDNERKEFLEMCENIRKYH